LDIVYTEYRDRGFDYTAKLLGFIPSTILLVETDLMCVLN
jgi:hypothetical protein